MNEYVKLSMKEFKLNPLHYVSLPGYSFDCWLMSSGVTLDTLQDKQMLDHLLRQREVAYVVLFGDRIVDNGGSRMKSHNRNIWYIDANNLYS